MATIAAGVVCPGASSVSQASTRCSVTGMAGFPVLGGPCWSACHYRRPARLQLPCTGLDKAFVWWLMVTYRVLGSTEVVIGDLPIDLGGRLPRRLLTALLVAGGHPVPDDQLVEAVWGDRAPADPGASLQVYVSRLRQRMKHAGLDVLRRAGRGYRLVVCPGATDVDRFVDDLAEGRALLGDGRPEEALRKLDEALGWWRGEAYADLNDSAAVQVARARLDELRETAVEERLAARLAMGDASGAVAELDAAVRATPYRERRWALLIVGLYRCGRQGDAFASLRRIRALLADDLGVDPGPELQRLEHDILTHNPALDWRPAPALSTAPGTGHSGEPLTRTIVDTNVRLRLPDERLVGDDQWVVSAQAQSPTEVVGLGGDPHQAVRGFDGALALWRGAPYAEVHDATRAAPEIARLEQLRLSVIEGRFTALLELGAHSLAVAELEAHVRNHPLREHGCELLALALYRAGRQADALAVLRATRTRLAEELGVDPGPALQRLERNILAQAPVLDWQPRPVVPTAAAAVLAVAAPGSSPGEDKEVVIGQDAPPATLPASVSAPLPVPRQLPAHTPYFVGRAAELRQLTTVLDATAGGGGTVVITAIEGTAGIGKTALALHWAHQAAQQFPDGQLYVNLRGFDPTNTPVHPADALRGFLDAFEFSPHRIPTSLDDLFQGVKVRRVVIS